MTWYPVVTNLQIGLDTSLSMSAPMGFGHVYAPSDYLDAWIEAAGPGDWSPQELDRLRRFLDDRRRAELAGDADETVDG